MPRVGVEEEFLIVDCVDGHAVPLGGLLERLNDDDGLSSEMKQEQIETCTLLDKGQIYCDARLSHRHPTVEVRVADACLFADDAILLAALVRGLVETAAREWRDDVPPVPVSAVQLRLASWQAGRFGLDADLLDPLTGRPRRAFDVAMELLDHVQPALRSQGEFDIVESLLFQALTRGNGADRQRATFAKAGSMCDVIADAVEVSNLPVTPLPKLTDSPLMAGGQSL